MSLRAGALLGPYEIIAPLGAGGMGEVYRARDTKLNRDVALKVLPDSFANDPDRLARFQREAQVLASLNHPNIAHIHGLEESGGARALVMELVEGEDLAQRIARGPIPIDEALPIAKQLADALEAAHEQGIIHRDLKPANIKVREDGTVKVLDFGLAKAMEPVGSPPNVTQSPTITTPAMMTYAGVILGTAAYMSPEQARGKPVDRRTDVWAFGCVLYEMLTGRHAFEPGETVSDAIVTVLSREPDWPALPADTPSSIRLLLRRCLRKDPQTRLPHIGAARLEIDETRSGSATETGEGLSADGATVTPVQAPGWRTMLPWTIAAAALATAAALVMIMTLPRRVELQTPVRLTADVGADVSILDSGAAVALSANGSVLALSAQSGGRTRLYVRRLDRFDATVLPGGDGANNPFFSPDGQWIAFFAAGSLKKISVNGGAAVTLADTGGQRGGTWSEDGTIIFGHTSGGLARVSSNGGKPEPVTSLLEGEATHRYPQVLPGGKAVLFTSYTSPSGTFDQANIVVQPLPSGPPKIVQRGGYYGRYVPSGHLVYIRNGTLFAVPFDLGRLQVAGETVPVVEDVTSNPTLGAAQFAVSSSGTLVYRTHRGVTGGGVPIAWMGTDGRTTPLRTAPSDWANVLFSPDGRRLAMDIFDAGQSDVWVYEWARDTLTRVTFGREGAEKPVWTPDGTRIVFASSRGSGALNLYWKRADGTGEIQRLTESPNFQGAWSFHPNGRLLAFHQLTPATQDDVLILPIEGDEASGWKPGKPQVFLNGPYPERAPMFSPDGRWIAYQSGENGTDEIYVRPYPGPGGKWQISSGGGVTPTWSRTKRELFYSTLDQRIMVAPYAVDGDSFRPEKPRLWADTRFLPRARTGPTRSFDVSPDGTRFALAPAGDGPATATQGRIVYLSNFFDELRRVVPASRK